MDNIVLSKVNEYIKIDYWIFKIADIKLIHMRENVIFLKINNEYEQMEFKNKEKTIEVFESLFKLIAT